MEYLFSKNHKNIAFINVDEKYNFAYQRKQGYIKFLKKNNLSFKKNLYISIGNEDPDEAALVIEKKILNNSKITAIICSTEYSAAELVKACNKLNKKIGIDISLITFDRL